VAWRKPREGKTEDQLIRTSSVLRRSTPVGPQGSKPGQHHACASPLPSLPFLPPAFSLSLPPLLPSLPPSLPLALSLSLSLPPLFSSFSISRCSSSISRARSAHAHVHAGGAHTGAGTRVHGVTAILSALSGHLPSPQLLLFLSPVRATTSSLAAVIHHRSEISGQ